MKMYHFRSLTLGFVGFRVLGAMGWKAFVKTVIKNYEGTKISCFKEILVLTDLKYRQTSKYCNEIYIWLLFGFNQGPFIVCMRVV